MQQPSSPAGPVYGPAELEVMTKAFETSYSHLLAERDSRLGGRQAYYTRETIAKLILGYAQKGEHDLQGLISAVIDQMDVVRGKTA